MKVLLFSGTTEGRELSEKLVSLGHDVTVCVATEYGREEQAQVEGAAILTGRKSVDEMVLLLEEKDLCVDATHPYATEVTANVRAAAEAVGVPYRRVRRALSAADAEQSANVVFFADAAAVAEYLYDHPGNVLLATGAKELPLFEGLSPERLFPRVLPSVDNLSTCEGLGIPHRNIIAMQGPFTKELNIALLRQKNIRFFVTKDGGATGGFPEKREAANEAGAVLLVILPPEDAGLTSEELLEELK